MTKILVDVFGGDNSPQAQIEGALLALKERPDLFITLVGDENKILQHEKFPSGEGCPDRGGVVRLDVLHAPDVISADESPMSAIKEKKNSSMVVMLNALKAGEFDAAVSSGSTGALLMGAFTVVRRINGVSRPALATVVPTVEKFPPNFRGEGRVSGGGSVIFMDCGANADCKPEHLLEFALMGAAYAKASLGAEKPRVALLSNGTEDAKGNELTQAAFRLLSPAGSFRFMGNIEARDIMSGIADVVVTDGFTGNVALKASEGMAANIFSILKKEITGGGLRAKLGYLLLKKPLKNVKKSIDYSEIGGAIFLGVEKPVIKAHGASNAKAMCAAILQAAQIAESGLIEDIKCKLQK